MTREERMWAKIRLNSDYTPLPGAQFRFYDPALAEKITEAGKAAMNSKTDFWGRPENPHLRVPLPWDFERILKFDMWGTQEEPVWGMRLREPFKSWADQNMRGLCGIGQEEGGYAIYFEEERDAVLFKLFFADDLL